jgi:tetratricopeptide (TPR) repeat protein
MSEAAADGAAMTDVAKFAPGRILLSGLGRLAIGGIALGMAGLIAYLLDLDRSAHPDNAATSDVLPALLGAIAVFSLIALLILPGAIGRIRSAFAKGCYFRAGAAGIEICLPRRRWWGRYDLPTYRFRWEEIDKLVDFTHRVSGIPTGRELRIELADGSRLRVERFYFSESVAAIQERLLDIRAHWLAAASETAALESAKTRLKEAQEHEAAGNFEAAVDAAIEAVRLDPENATLRNWLGHFLFRQGRLKEAAEIIESAIALAPDQELYHYALGNVLLHDGRLLGAATTLKRAIELDPNDAHAHHALGIALARAGDLAGARAELAILEKLEPARAERLRQELPPT